MKKTIERMDIFASPLSHFFTVNNSTKVGTRIGFFASIVIYVLLFAFAVTKTISLVTKQGLEISYL
jgi:hypothetical protein